MKSCKASILALIFSLICVGAVSAGTLSRIYIDPGSVGLTKLTSQQFVVHGLDAEGNDVPVSGPVTWSVASTVGTITQDGVFTAGTTVGWYPEAIKASVSGGFSAMAAVHIIPPKVSGNYFFDRCRGNAAPGEFAAPTSVAVDSQGNFYVVDWGNDRVQKFDPQGNYILQWGYYGTGPDPDQFDSPYGIAIDSQDKVYITDTWHAKVQVFNTSGQYIRTLGTGGSGDGQFSFPYNVTVDAADNVYVLDTGNYNVQKFDSTGKFISRWGSFGTGEEQLYCPSGIAVDKNGIVYITDPYYWKVQLFDQSGKYLGKWDSSNGHRFDSPRGITTDKDGIIYVADGSIQEFDSTGKLLKKIDANQCYLYDIATAATGKLYTVGFDSNIAIIFDTQGNQIGKVGFNGLGHANWTNNVAFDSHQNTYLCDSDNRCIWKYAPNSTCIKKIGSNGSWPDRLDSPQGMVIDSNDCIYVADGGLSCVKKYDTEGKLLSKIMLADPDGKPIWPWDVALGPNGSFYVNEWQNCYISRYDSTGHLLSRWGSEGSGDGQIGGYQFDISSDPQGFLYVTDYANNRVQKFDSNGNLINKCIGDGQISWPDSVAVDSKGFVYVTDNINSGIVKCDSTGHFVSKWEDKQGGEPWQFAGRSGLAVSNTGKIITLDAKSRRILTFFAFGTSVGATKTHADGEMVGLADQITTAGTTNFGNCFYIESTDRTSGIKVTGVTAYGARKVSVSGILATVNGEREIQAFSCTSTSSGNIKPIAMNNKAVGGGKTGYQDGVWRHQTVPEEDGKPQTVWAKSKGLNNIGLFIRTFGKVISSDTSTHTFMVSDGSSQDGIKCWAPANLTLPTVGNIIAVNGVSTCERNERGELTPLLRLRGAIDITTIKKATL